MSFPVVGDPLVTITERNFNLAGDLAVLTGDDQFDPSEMILGQFVIENLEHAIDAMIEFPFLRFSEVGAAHSIWKEMEEIRTSRGQTPVALMIARASWSPGQASSGSC